MNIIPANFTGAFTTGFKIFRYTFSNGRNNVRADFSDSLSSGSFLFLPRRLPKTVPKVGTKTSAYNKDQPRTAKTVIGK